LKTYFAKTIYILLKERKKNKMSAQIVANSTFDLEAYILEIVAMNTYTDKLFLCLVLPMSMLGFVFNSISFGIFCKKEFRNISLFKFLQIYTLASSIGSFGLIFCFYASPYTFPELLLTSGSRIFNCKGFFVILNIYVFENILDIFINIERAVCFSTGFKRYKLTSPYIICSIIFFISILVQGPLYFIYHILTDSELEDRIHNTSLPNRYKNICELSKFTLSLPGEIVLMVTFFISGPVVLVLSIVTNLIALISYKRFMARKKNLTAQPQNNQKNESQIKKEKEKEDNERKLLYMTCFLSIYSCINHAIQFATEFIAFIAALDPKIVAWYFFFGFGSISVKHLLNIVIFAFFNKRFKEALFFWRK